MSQYQANDFPRPLFMLDAALFTYHQSELQTLLVQRANHPARGQWGLPGGFVNVEDDANLDSAVRRILAAKTAVVPAYIEQVGSYGDAHRDPRGWSVTLSFTALIAHQACAQHIDSVSDVQWAPVAEALQRELAFDHKRLLTDARERMRQKALYSIVPGYALPEEFTLPELQHLHEVLIGKPLQKKSFRRRIEQANLLQDTGKKRAEGGRPAVLYKMKSTMADHYFVRNLEA